MKRKRFLCYVFLFIFLFSIPAVITVLEIKKLYIKKEIKNKIITGIDKSELVLLKFSKNETLKKLKWEHSKEFEYNGEMYDVVETNETNDSVYYLCWWDNEETILNKKLNNILSTIWGSNTIKLNISKQLSDFFKSLYFKKFNLSYFIHQPFFNFQFFLHNSFYRSFKIEPLVPPPWL